MKCQRCGEGKAGMLDDLCAECLLNIREAAVDIYFALVGLDDVLKAERTVRGQDVPCLYETLGLEGQQATVEIALSRAGTPEVWARERDRK